MPFGSHSRFARLLQRCAALGSTALVVALFVLAASPELHHKLHGGDTNHGDDQCAIALFAAGVSSPSGAIRVDLAPAAFRVPRAEPAEQLDLATPRYLRQPERGPPSLS
jgi:hypothetical protein